MYSLPLVSLFFLILIYRVHRTIFWVVSVLEILLYVIGVSYIETTYSLASNQFLHYLALTGIGLVIGIAGFFTAISVNHKHLYSDFEAKTK